MCHRRHPALSPPAKSQYLMWLMWEQLMDKRDISVAAGAWNWGEGTGDFNKEETSLRGLTQDASKSEVHLQTLWKTLFEYVMDYSAGLTPWFMHFVGASPQQVSQLTVKVKSWEAANSQKQFCEVS